MPWRLAPLATVIALLAWHGFPGERTSKVEPAAVAAALSPAARAIVDASLGPEPILRRWDGPVRIELVGSWAQSDRDQVAAWVARWATAAPGLDIALTGEGQGNVVVYLLPAAEFAGYDGRAAAGADRGVLTRVWDEGAIIERVRVLMDAALPIEVRRHRLHQELYAGLGLRSEHPGTNAALEALAFWYRKDFAVGYRWPSP